jgi:hypothetical protein
MCVKHQRRCPILLAIREQALAEWCEAESYEQVRSCWSRLGGRTTLHRYGHEHYSSMAMVRWSR